MNARANRPEWNGPAEPTSQPTTSGPTDGPEPGRARLALLWLRYHRLELTSVGVPLALAAFHSWLWTIPTALSAVGWAAHEIHQHRTGHTGGETDGDE
jgi:hypothetical protein